MKFSKAALFALPLVAGKAEERDLQISPLFVNVHVNPGGTSEGIMKMVGTMEVPQNLELCLLSDATGSFGDDQVELIAASMDIAMTISTDSPGAKFGYTAFKDEGDDFVYKLLQPLTTDYVAWKGAISSLVPSGGGDFPEAQYDGIACSVDIDDCPTGSKYSSADCGFSDPSDPSAKVLVVTTDATFATDSGVVNDETSTTAALVDAGVTLIGLKAPGAGGELDTLATATGGSVVPLESDGSNVADAILEGLGNLPATVTVSKVTCDPELSMTFDATEVTVVAGETANFKEYVHVDDSAPHGCCYCAVEFSENGVVMGEQTIAVSVGHATGECGPGEPGDPHGAFGDPHIKGWHGDYFDFHGECDLVMVDSPSFRDVGLTSQIRTKIRNGYSYINAAAIKIGEDILEVNSYGAYLVNGVYEAEMPAKLNGFEVTHTQVNKKRNVFKVDLGFGEYVELTSHKDLVSMTFYNATFGDFGDSVGIMGNYHGALLGRDGKTVFSDPVAFGMEWQVSESEPKLFDVNRHPQAPLKCLMPTEKVEQRRLGENQISDEAAQLACAHVGDQKMRDMCVYDVLATNDLEAAQSGAY